MCLCVLYLPKLILSAWPHRIYIVHRPSEYDALHVLHVVDDETMHGDVMIALHMEHQSNGKDCREFPFGGGIVPVSGGQISKWSFSDLESFGAIRQPPYRVSIPLAPSEILVGARLITPTWGHIDLYPPLPPHLLHHVTTHRLTFSSCP